MQDAQMLRMHIIDVLKILPLESLKALAKFTDFLHYTFQQGDLAQEVMLEENDIIHFEVVQPPNPVIRSPRLTYPEQMVYLEKKMEILDEDPSL